MSGIPLTLDDVSAGVGAIPPNQFEARYGRGGASGTVAASPSSQSGSLFTGEVIIIYDSDSPEVPGPA